MESLRYDMLDLQEIAFDEGKGKYTYFADNDLLIAKVTPCFENGNIAIAKNLKENIGFGSSEIFILRPNKKNSSRYMFYYVQTNDFRNNACATMCGVGGLKRISPLFMRTYELDIPSLQVQQRIVEYLDAKIAEIDKKIELLGKKRDAYKRLKTATINRAVTRGLDEHVKLKDSGIEWLGEIPAHWETRRIKDFFTNVSGNGFKVEFQGNEQGDYPFYKVSDLNGETKEVSHAKNYVTKSIAAQESYNIIPAHSILFPKIGEALKKNYRRINMDQCCVDNNCSALVIKDSHICLNYAYYIMRCIDMSWFDNGGTIPSVCISKLMSTSIPVPSFREQEFIVHYIDDRCAKIDEAVTIIDKQIDALKRLKRSLINEVVTGKRMV